MRKSILSAVAGVTFLLGIAACSEENKYDSVFYGYLRRQ